MKNKNLDREDAIIALFQYTPEVVHVYSTLRVNVLALKFSRHVATYRDAVLMIMIMSNIMSRWFQSAKLSL